MTSTPAAQPTTPKRVSKMASTQNMNHLLNFTLPPRQARPPVNLPRRSRKTGTQQGVWNKERFVNAQYRFVMNPTGDYTVHFADPDIFFQWHDILQVIVPRSSALASAAGGGHSGQEEGNTTCPICLSPPTAPRMTKCGHVFCFPCILHYLSTSENKWARCPICFDSVNEKQLKSVKWYDGPTHIEEDSGPPKASSSSSATDDTFEIVPRAGSSMHMRLMQRPQITTLALPRSQSWPSDLLPPHQAPFHFLPDVFNFAKFMLATPDYLITDLSRDLDELATERRILSGMNDDLGMSFVDGADQKVRHQMAKAAALESPPLMERINKALRDQHEIAERVAFHDNRRKAEEALRQEPSDVPEEFMALKSGANRTPTPRPNAEPTPRSATPAQGRNTPRQRRNVNPPPPSTSTYYYYQAASGLPLFLHPLDIKVLLSHFHSYASFPDTITIRVESFAEGTVNDDLRKRCKYLGHMPESADVVFIEADLEGVVGAEGLKNFEGALRMRTARRKEKGRKDDRARTRAEEREKEREKSTLGWTDVVSSYSSFAIPDSPMEDFASLPDVQIVPAPPVSGAWGQRSFASALHSGPTNGGAPQQRVQRPEVVDDDWDVDAAWHELERNVGGRKKRGTRLVVLGSGGGGRRR
ncbi:putative RING finger protein P8B7.23 [Hypsizygus marmoreus]|uniref:RING finger protein P8B7.23 n=1 Tax=Hypsizygus marmoreus TaxID=39966 RepID=A0A369K8W5_HYPMA|nr:putative RING finger protein P8B7.23 [Hypsizygus marmoreus]